MELAIPLLALGGLYVVSNKNKDNQNSQQSQQSQQSSHSSVPIRSMAIARAASWPSVVCMVARLSRTAHDIGCLIADVYAFATLSTSVSVGSDG